MSIGRTTRTKLPIKAVEVARIPILQYLIMLFQYLLRMFFDQSHNY